MANNWKRSNWKYETSEDSTVSVLASVSWGTFVLRNTITNDVMKINYKCLSAGFSKGFPLGYTESSLANESAGTHVWSLGTFTEDVFPCFGWMAGLGATLGVFDNPEPGVPSDTWSNGGNAGVVIFEVLPFARFFCYGEFRATTPGAGISLGSARFSLD